MAPAAATATFQAPGLLQVLRAALAAGLIPCQPQSLCSFPEPSFHHVSRYCTRSHSPSYRSKSSKFLYSRNIDVPQHFLTSWVSFLVATMQQVTNSDERRENS